MGHRTTPEILAAAQRDLSEYLAMPDDNFRDSLTIVSALSDDAEDLFQREAEENVRAHIYRFVDQLGNALGAARKLKDLLDGMVEED